jgi:RNA polymerase sigma-70 factor (ECF subfamily)
MSEAREETRDEIEFQRLALSYLDDVARFARWLTKDETEAEDLVQDTYLKALRAWKSFHADSASDCKAWLITICRNTHYSHRRREGRVETVEAPELEALAAVGVFHAAQAGGLDGAFGQFDLRDAVHRELRDLPLSFREAVVLVDIQDLSYHEAARILDIPVGTVRSRLFRGRRLLQERLLVHARDAGFSPGSARDAE